MISSHAYGQLIGLGLGMGVIHVLSGPDHLSALATLSVGGHWKAFYLGIRWGLGHSTGLVLVAIILLSVGDKLDMHSIESYCDWIVGAFMLGLGAYGVFRAVKNEQSRKRRELDANHSTTIELANGDKSAAAQGRGDACGAEGSEDGATSHHDDSVRAEQKVEGEGEREKEKTFGASEPGVAGAAGGGDVSVRGTEGVAYVDDDVEAAKRCACLLKRCHAENPAVIRVVAFCIGVVHGIAGPGGVLGVLPAVHLHNRLSASLYLLSFCLTSTLCMGVFAMVYGELTARMSEAKSGRVQFGLGLFSAGLSLAVGVVWITLSALGILGKVFD